MIWRPSWGRIRASSRHLLYIQLTMTEAKCPIIIKTMLFLSQINLHRLQRKNKCSSLTIKSNPNKTSPMLNSFIIKIRVRFKYLLGRQARIRISKKTAAAASGNLMSSNVEIWNKMEILASCSNRITSKSIFLEGTLANLLRPYK